MEFKRFFNISSTKNKIGRLNLCHALKSRMNFKTIKWQLNTVMFCNRQHMLCGYRCSKYKQEHGCNRSCSQSWERKAMDFKNLTQLPYFQNLPKSSFFCHVFPRKIVVSMFKQDFLDVIIIQELCTNSCI